MGGARPPIEDLRLFQFQLVHCRDTEATIDVNDFTRMRLPERKPIALILMVIAYF